MKRRRIGLIAFTGFVLVATACGGDDADANASTTSTVAADMVAMDSTGTDGMEMSMGDANATPAEDVSGAEVVTGAFVLLDTRLQGYDEVTGEAALARHADGTTVTIRLENLQPGVDYISHVHEGVCADNGGPHYKFDANGSSLPPNEIHLAFTAAADGTGFMTAENAQVATEEARSVVVHPVEFLDNKIACGEFGE